MIQQNSSPVKRGNTLVMINSDLIVVGGGMAGTCAAIAAARNGIKVILVQDRPVLGGNASSEVRLWILGATSHLGNNNRWAREGGVIDEILIENLYRNKEGNAVIFDTILLEKVISEPNITLLLNTMVFDLEKSDEENISSIRAFCSQNSTEYSLTASLFCDASGDGIVGFRAGASFRMGTESKQEFGELFAPDVASSEILGHSMYFYSKRVESPVKFAAPSYALKNITEIPRYKVISKEDNGCRYWWLEYGGKTDTIHKTEEIKWELWKVIYGVWDYIKNSGEFEDVENLTLEWVATIPGKRESRRFEGLYMLKQQDLVEQLHFEDTVAHGGWAMDLHPADGVYSPQPGCTQWHTKGVYQIPFRCYVSKDISNLFFAGRIISATHVAFGSTRVMATSALGGQAVGMAAAISIREKIKPAGLLAGDSIRLLQNRLNIDGQGIVNVPVSRDLNLASNAEITVSSELKISQIAFNGDWTRLKYGTAQLLPFRAGQKYRFKILAKADTKTTLEVQLRISSKSGNYTPDVILESFFINLGEGEQMLDFEFSSATQVDQYAFVTFLPNNQVCLKNSNQRITGILSLFNSVNKAVSNFGKQSPPEGIGVDSFEFWIPERRPNGRNIAMEITPAINFSGVENLRDGYVRPGSVPRAWVAGFQDKKPKVVMKWKKEINVNEIRLYFDTDYDHPLESTLMGHPEEVIPFCIRNYTIKSLSGKLLFEKTGNYQTINCWRAPSGFMAKGLIFEFEHPSAVVPASLFEILVQ